MAGATDKHVAKTRSGKVGREIGGERLLADLIYNKPGYLFRRMQQIAVSIFLEEVSELDITPLQYGALAVVRSYPGIDQSGLGNSLGLDRTTVVGIVDRMERKGWMTRKTSPTDRRMRQLFITPAGISSMDEARPATDKAQERMLEPLSVEEARIFIDLLERIVVHHNDDSRVPVKQGRHVTAELNR